MKLNRAWFAVVLVLCASAGFAQQSTEEQAVWKLEHSYWEYVKALDLKGYLELWHPNFVGWPSVSAQPQRKNHITDWITANTSKGLHLKSYSLEPAASQVTGNIVVVHYWLTSVWADKDGRGEPHTLRVTHTWIKDEKGWQIIGGMSSPELAASK
ncbi:MAG TPA: nuclear transport factor 2 family protein [Candidatus Sulfotelmatobacter sp.]|nr:nuclear transport factor 2 family protein [Candidatus Sulfotelmatobacter sp.]